MTGYLLFYFVNEAYFFYQMLEKKKPIISSDKGRIINLNTYLMFY